MLKPIHYAIILLSLLLFYSCNGEGDEGGNKEKNEKTAANTSKPQKKKEDKAFTKAPDKSLEELNIMIRNDINNADLYRQRALVYAGKGDYQAARADMERAIKLAPDSAVYHLTKADFLFKLNFFDQAYDAVEVCLDHNPKSEECLLKLSQYNLFFQNYKKSIEYADKALQIDMYNPNAYFIKGINFLETGDTLTAISSFQTAVEQDQEFLRAYLQLALIHYLKDDPLAVEYYKNALRIDSNNMEAHYNLAMYYQRHDQYNEALETYTKMTKINPNYKQAYFNMGYIHLQDLKVFDVAAQYFTEAIEVDPNWEKAYYNRGYSYELMGDIQKARKDYEKALKLKPNYDRAAQGLSRVNKTY